LARPTSTATGAVATTIPSTSTPSLRTFASLHDRDFRWYYLAMLCQMAAMNMQLIVRGYVVFDITKSFTALGAIALASSVPMLLLSMFGGVLADRTPKKIVLQAGQLVSVLLAVIVGLLLLSGSLVLWHLFVASVAQGITMALMMPARQAMIPDVVGRDLLMNAVALNSAGMNLMRLLAPAAGGFLIWGMGAGSVYMVMGALYFCAVLTLIPVPRRGAVTAGPAKGGFADLRDGFAYVRKDGTILAVLGVSFLTAFLAMPYMQLLPGFVDAVLDGGPVQLGLLTAVSGGGALFGALVIASLPERHRGVLLLASAILLGAALVVFASSQEFWFAAIAMVFVGVGTAGRQAFSQILLHAYVEDEYRGRVMALMMIQPGMMSLGAFFVGITSEVIGVERAIAILAGLLVVASGLLLIISPRLRQLR